MSRRLEELNKPQVRKSFVVIGGAAVGAALFGFILMNFVFGGNSEAPAPPVTAPSGQTATVPDKLSNAEHEPLREGGRDPFIVGTGSGAQAAAVTAPVATPAPSASTTSTTATAASKPVYYEVLSTTEETADVKVGGKTFNDAKPGTEVSEDSKIFSIAGDCVFFQKDGERFRVCQGERYLA